MKLGFLFKQVMLKMSLTRAYQNDFLMKESLAGEGIDLGAKSRDSKYYNYININEVKDITFVDYFREGKGIIKLDLEEDLPIYDNKYDFIICFNVFEHIYNGRNLAKECLRILRPNGHFFGFVPFLVYYHADPNDYIRYTHQGLERLFADAGFDNVEITSVGYGAFQAAVAQFASLLRFRLLKFVVYAVAMGLDNLHRRFSSRTTAWTLSYHIKAHKKAAGPA